MTLGRASIALQQQNDAPRKDRNAAQHFSFRLFLAAPQRKRAAQSAAQV